MWIGLDDTDSKDKGCTTFICYELINQLYRNGYCLCSYPRLIRLNPQIPWKTRGNGAVALEIGRGKGKDTVFGIIKHRSFFLNPDVKDINVDKNEVISIVKDVIEKYADVKAKQTNPAFVLVSKKISKEFYNKAVHEIAEIEEAVNIIKKFHGYYYLYKNGRGIIGATAAIAWDESKDYTFELITYRKQEFWKTKRYIDDRSVIVMDQKFISTFDNYDYENRYNCIVPHSPCPILFGIRGDNVTDLPRCMQMIQSEDSLGWMIFISNQGTDDHLRKKKVSEIKPFQSVIVQGNLLKKPHREKGGHVFFSICDVDGGIIDCAAYEPTKNFRNVIEQLHIGDEVEVYGGIREIPLSVNIEKIYIKSLCDVFEKIENPICPRCNKHMKSRGKEKGYQCVLCKTKSGNPIFKKNTRIIREGFYEVPACARRHLSKPLIRMKVKPKKLYELHH